MILNTTPLCVINYVINPLKCKFKKSKCRENLYIYSRICMNIHGKILI